MAVQVETCVFVRLLAEREQAGFINGFAKAFNGGVRALKDTMLETQRFGILPENHIEGCARDRLSFYIDSKDASPTNLVIPASTTCK